MTKQITREDLIHEMVDENLIEEHIAQEWIAASRPTRADLVQLNKNIYRKLEENNGEINTMTYANYCDYQINRKYSNYLYSHTILMSAMTRPFDDNFWSIFLSYPKKKQKTWFDDLKNNEAHLKELQNNNKFFELVTFAKKSISIGYLSSMIKFEELCNYAWQIYTPNNYRDLFDLLLEGANSKILKESFVNMLGLKNEIKKWDQDQIDDFFKHKITNDIRYGDLCSSLPFNIINHDRWQKERQKQYDVFASQFCKYEEIKEMKFNTLKNFCFKQSKKIVTNDLK